MIVGVVEVRCSEQKVSEVNVLDSIQCLLQLMLLLDKADSFGVTQVLVKFRSKKFQDKLWGRGLEKPMQKAFRQGCLFFTFYIVIFQSTHSCLISSYPYLSVFFLFSTTSAFLPTLCFSFHAGCQASCNWIPNSVVASPSIPCCLPPQMLQMVIETSLLQLGAVAACLSQQVCSLIYNILLLPFSHKNFQLSLFSNLAFCKGQLFSLYTKQRCGPFFPKLQAILVILAWL